MVLEQLGIQAETRVDEERPAIHHADLHGMSARGQEEARRCVEVGGNAVVAAEVVEGAARQHGERAAAAERRLRDGTQRAVAARAYHHAALRDRVLDGHPGAGGEFGGVVDEAQFKTTARAAEFALQDGARGVGLPAAGARVHYDEKWSVGGDREHRGVGGSFGGWRGGRVERGHRAGAPSAPTWPLVRDEERRGANSMRRGEYTSRLQLAWFQRRAVPAMPALGRERGIPRWIDATMRRASSGRSSDPRGAQVSCK